MKILKTLNDAALENTYYLVNDQAVLVIDPGSNTDEILKQIKSINKPLAAVLLTHAHYDHIMSLDAVRQQFNHPPVYISEKEASWLGSPRDNLSGLDRHSDMEDIIAAPADFYFDYEKIYQLSGFTFKVVPTPGHSWGSVSFIFDDDQAVFSGDALFRETIGRTDLPTGNFDELIKGIRENLFTLPNHFQVFPGHGPETHIGHEKNFNPFF
ncbi:MBL fold metallo-hydrolase [Streptococcus ratti]|uniref:Hydrolase n=1 Tax=Streptococcus ratti FA-1 = DSM 20564 TaxID=699248 RepID=A0ABN0GTQ6_STRRT|nr:MBL fold metallo-hydrolase [Streptococcus ratti]EJN93530.1 hydrolase [Streptococcus ratti FA-1 = DSM 20564]EMP71852.1 hydrolase [Streptococcus ratti FA-1 = DSM 20564]QEY07403.1 MBL fold metallo-hydrolase [Streptococcus ratti]VEI59851.1 hydrolase [Streptococcus mutans]